MGRRTFVDLSADFGERSDLGARHPDIVARLERLLNDWEADVDKGAPARR